MSPSTAPQLHIHKHDIAVSVIIAVTGVFGLMSNGTAILAVLCNPALRSSFGLLCFSHGIANIGILLVFVFWLTPMTLIQDHIAAKLAGKLLGLVNIMLWNVCVYSHLAIALNRIIAITLPIQAFTILTVRNTFYVVLLCWTLGFCHAVPYFWKVTLKTTVIQTLDNGFRLAESCFIVFNVSTWKWSFAETECGYIISTFTDFYTSLIVFITIFLLDTITLICIRLRHMALCQNALFSYQLVSFHYLSSIFQNEWGVFLTTTFPWEVCHTLDGFIVVLFHFRFSHLAKKTSNRKTLTTKSRIVPVNTCAK